ncbi:MAG: trigger factor [Pelagibacteraceae bacterium TMED287]|nr:MAG: trigger factor [Pelagibacteraceae bacterium TMED287]
MKTFGEGKDLNYVIEVDSLPEIKLGSLENFKVTNYMVTADAKIVDEKLKEIANQHKNFIDKKDSEKAEIGDQITFDYSAKVNENKFKGSEGKGVQIELGKDLFLKDFDKQLIGKKKNDIALTESHLPPNHPDKELANKKAKFECKILSVKKPGQTKIDDNLAKNLGAKSLIDLKKLIENQISSQYKQALDSITKKEILDQLEKSHSIDLPKNLVDHELSAMTQSLKKDEIEKNKIKNEKLAKSRIKLGLILNEFGEKNNLKVGQDEINNEIQKQIRGMPGQEKMVLEYYKKNPHAAQSLKGALYEEKIINLLKSKITMKTKNLSTNEAEKIINDLNKPKESLATKAKSKKISKK